MSVSIQQTFGQFTVRKEFDKKDGGQKLNQAVVELILQPQSKTFTLKTPSGNPNFKFDHSSDIGLCLAVVEAMKEAILFAKSEFDRLDKSNKKETKK